MSLEHELEIDSDAGLLIEMRSRMLVFIKFIKIPNYPEKVG